MVKSLEVFWDSCKNEFKNFYLKYKNHNIILFGAASYGRWMLSWLQDIGFTSEIVAFSDNNKKLWGEQINGIKCNCLDNILNDYPDAVIIICSSWAEEIEEDLRKKYSNIDIHQRSVWMEYIETQIGYILCGKDQRTLNVAYFLKEFDKNKHKDTFLNSMTKVEELLMDEESKEILRKRISFLETGDVSLVLELPYMEQEYFCEELFPITETETYVDCGTYTGDTIEKFIKYTKNEYSKIIAFEPDSDNFRILKHTVDCNAFHDVYAYNVATGNAKGKIRFNNMGTMGSFISDEGTESVDVVKLDDFIKEPVSIIKMDIEGAELDTLKGAKNIVETYKPKLAICVYHRWDDIFTIPLYLHTLVPEYKFKIRHHSMCMHDIVLYAYV